MYRSPPYLRSGAKGQPVCLSTADKSTKVQRSLSSSSPASCSSKTSTMGPSTTDKTSKQVDSEVVKKCVDAYVASDNFMDNLFARLTAEIKTIVETAVKAAVQTALTAVNVEIKQLRDEVSALRGQLVDRTDELEQYSRRNNVRIFGVKETATEDIDTKVMELCREKLGVTLPAGAICRSHRVGRTQQPDAQGRERHRAIIVRFTSYQHRRDVFAAKKRLKGTGITIREDLTIRRVEVYRRAASLYGMKNTWTTDGRVHWLDEQGTRGMATKLADLPATPDSK